MTQPAPPPVPQGPRVPYHDRPDQLEKIQAGLFPGEVIDVVFDCTGVGTGFVGLTNMRLVMQDNSFVGKKSALTSIPLDHVQSVSFVSDKSFLGDFFSSSQIAIQIGGVNKFATFRGTDKAKHIHDTLLRRLLRVPGAGGASPRDLPR